jgi:uncharacterized protein (TIGR03032 family)
VSIHSGPPPAGLFELDFFNTLPSPGFAGWLAERRISLAFTTGNRLMLAGVDAAGELYLEERVFDATTGLAAVGSHTLYLAARWQLWRFENALAPGTRDRSGNDRRYLAQTAHTTGFVGVYDIAVDPGGRPLFTSALFNCVSRTADRADFAAVWTPPFISSVVPEDRCHLTGLALEGDELAYVTCAAATDVARGWEREIVSGGVIVDARAGEVLARGMSMPHSPRLHDGRLYVLGSGTGELLAVDRATGAAETVATVPGFARGLAFAGNEAVVGCSRLTGEGPYTEAPIWSSGTAMHGIAVVDLAEGRVAHSLEFQGASGDVFAVTVLPDTVHPSASESLGGLRDQVSVGEPGSL